MVKLSRVRRKSAVQVQNAACCLLQKHLRKQCVPQSQQHFQNSVYFGYVRTQHTSLIKVFTVPSDYNYATKDEVAKQVQATVLAAAKPTPCAEPSVPQK